MNQLNKTFNKKILNFEDMLDHEIVAHAQLGDKLAFKEIVRRYQKIVYAFLYQLAPDWSDNTDLAQEVFIRVFRNLHSLKNPKYFKSWLNQIVINLFYDELRKKPRNLVTVSIDQYKENDDNSEYNLEIGDTKSLPDQQAGNTELREAITKAIGQLPEQYRNIIVLRELQGLQYEEIADLLGLALGTVKSRIARAREKLQSSLKDYKERSIV